MSNKPKREDVKIWIRALRSGKYKQAKGRLQTANGYCCLGVACELFAGNHVRDGVGYLYGMLPHVNKGAPEWLSEVDGLFFQATFEYLSTLNDDKGFTFDEIADCLQAVYIHEVLK